MKCIGNAITVVGFACIGAYLLTTAEGGTWGGVLLVFALCQSFLYFSTSHSLAERQVQEEAKRTQLMREAMETSVRQQEQQAMELARTTFSGFYRPSPPPAPPTVPVDKAGH